MCGLIRKIKDMAKSLASKIGQVTYLQKGEKGDAGNRGPSLRGPLDWKKVETGFKFQSGADGEEFIDIVTYNGKYYQCIVSHSKSSSRYPGSSYNYWRVASSLPFVASDLLLTTYALIKNLGVEAVEMKDSDGNIIFRVKDGNVTCKEGIFENVEVSGDLTATSIRLKQHTGAAINAVNGAITTNHEITLPRLQPGECMEVKMLTPIATRLNVTYVFHGTTSAVKIYASWDTGGSTLKGSYIGGVCIDFIGRYDSSTGITIWQAIPLNDEARSLLEGMTVDNTAILPGEDGDDGDDSGDGGSTPGSGDEDSFG